MTLFKNYLDKLLKANTDADALQSGTSVTVDRLAVDWESLPTLTAGASQLLNWTDTDAIGTALSVDANDHTMLHGASGLYSLMLQVAANDPTMTDMQVEIVVSNTEGHQLLPYYTGPFGVHACLIDGNATFSILGLLLEVDADFTFTIGVTSIGNVAPTALSGQNLDIRKLQ